MMHIFYCCGFILTSKMIKGAKQWDTWFMATVISVNTCTYTALESSAEFYLKIIPKNSTVMWTQGSVGY